MKQLYFTRLRLLSGLIILACLLLNACGEEPKPATPTAGATTGTTRAGTAGAVPTPTAASSAAQTWDSAAAARARELNLPPGTLLVEIPSLKPAGEISPYIYGLAAMDDKDPDYAAKLQPTLLRWGGNPSTRFNWALGNAWNAARDWDFRNGDYGNPGKDVASEAIAGTLSQNRAMLLTIPTIGWVARNTDNGTQSVNVPNQGGPPAAPGSEAIKGYDPTANRERTSVKSAARKNAPFVVKPDPNSPVVYQDEWVASLVSRFGPASKGGVKFYAMDNEPDIWSQTHTDVHPVRVGYDELLARFTEYASAIKDVDPSAMITGPVSWGWTGYFYSELDRGSDNFKTAADRAAHGGMPLLPWFLDQQRQYEQKNGKRLLDVLDIHYYPQANGLYGGQTDAKSNELRLRSTRSLWDSNYVDESWINKPVRLIPLMKEWINTYYPGTKLGITEWNFGADDTLNGGLAISQALGVFGREGLYLAAYWRNPPAGSPGFYAFKMYTNFDDKGSGFGDKSLPAGVSDDSKLSVYAGLDSKSGRVRLVVVNPQPGQAQKFRLMLPSALPAQKAGVYRLSAGTGNKLQAQAPLEISGGAALELEVPAYSATLYDLQP